MQQDAQLKDLLQQVNNLDKIQNEFNVILIEKKKLEL